jgi:hypothetical protein
VGIEKSEDNMLVAEFQDDLGEVYPVSMEIV